MEEGSMKTSEHLVHDMTKDELLELENRPKTKKDILLDRLICALPIGMGLLALAEYHFLPDVAKNFNPHYYVYFLGGLLTLSGIYFILSLFNKRVFKKLRYIAPFHVLVYFLLLLYDWATLKSGTLKLPYFPWVNQIIEAMINDRAYLWDSVLNSLKLLFTGYAWGVVLGLITGIACGYSRKISYWFSPFMSLIGAIPTITWIPITMVLVSSLFYGAVFIIAFGVWYAVSLATMSGIRNIDPAYYDVAKVLGSNEKQLITKVTLPMAMPNIFAGLTQGMSTACTALIVAEMIGVESGLGWYVTWQRNWAQYAKMYASIVIICLLFISVKFVVDRISRYVLRWQEGRM